MVRKAIVLILVLAACRESGSKLPHSKAEAVFAGGCFWSMESVFEKVRGVSSVTSGYVSNREAVKVVYDPSQISYAQLLDVYWRNIDPTNDTGQFCDRGDQYRTAIFVGDDAQRRLAVSTKAAIERSRRMLVVTDIMPVGAFNPAEESHQDYAKKNPVKYKFYRFNCGRDARLKQLWGSGE